MNQSFPGIRERIHFGIVLIMLLTSRQALGTHPKIPPVVSPKFQVDSPEQAQRVANDVAMSKVPGDQVFTSNRRVKTAGEMVALRKSSEESTKVVRVAATRTEASQPSGPNLPLEHQVRKVLIGVSILSLVGILLFLATYWKRQVAPLNSSAQLRLVSSLALAPRCTLSLIDASGQSFLVARDATGIKKIVPVRGEFETYLPDNLDESGDLMTATPWISK